MSAQLLLAWLLSACLIAMVLHQAKWLKKYRALCEGQNAALEGGRAIIEAYIRQGKGLRCDVCGNEMPATEQVDIIGQPDGSYLVAHSTHRAHTWGPPCTSELDR